MLQKKERDLAEKEELIEKLHGRLIGTAEGEVSKHLDLLKDEMSNQLEEKNDLQKSFIAQKEKLQVSAAEIAPKYLSKCNPTD